MPTLTADLEVVGGLVLEELGVVEDEEAREQFGPVTVFPPPSQRFLVLSPIYSPEV